MQISLSSDIIIGITLISFGVYTFSKGASQHLSHDNYIKSSKNIEKLLHTAATSNISINTEKDD